MNWVQSIAKILRLLPHNAFDRRLVLISVCASRVTLVFLLVLELVDKRKMQLSYLIRKEKRRIFGHRAYFRFLHVLRDIYYPSVSSTSIICGASLIAWILVFRSQFATSAEEMQLVARLQNLDAGIALVFVPFTIFAVSLSSRRTESTINTAEVLLKNSFIFPITVCVLTLLTSFSVVKRAATAQILVSITLLFAIFVIFKLWQILLDDERISTAAANLQQDKIRRAIGLAIDQRLGRNLLSSLLAGHPIEYGSVRSSVGGGFFEIFARREGFVRDINVSRLFDFARDLEAAANESGFSFGQLKSVGTSAVPAGDVMTETTVTELTPDRRRYVLKLFGDEVTTRSLGLISFHRQLVPNPQKRQDLKECGLKIFTIKAGNNYSNRVERYLGLIKDEAIAAIKDRRTAYLATLLGILGKVATTFADEMKKAIGGHSYQSAMIESQGIFGGWDEMKWISRHLREIHHQGCRSDDIFVAKLVAAAPLQIAFSLISYRDALIFDQFTSFLSSLYDAVGDANVKDTQIKALLFSTCVGYARDIGNVGIAIEIERWENTDVDFERLGSFASIMLLRYLELLKCAYDRDRLDHFREFLQGMNGLLEPHGAHWQMGAAGRLGGAHPPILKEDHERLEQERRNREHTTRVWDTTGKQRQEALFVVGSYILERSLSDSRANAYLDAVDSVFDISAAQLSEVYSRNDDSEAHQIWERAFYAEGPFGVSRNSRIDYFLYLLLKFNHAHGEQHFLDMRVSQEPAFVSELGVPGPATALLQDFEENRERWANRIPDAWLPTIPKLRQVFARAVAKRRKSEEDEIIHAPIDAEYIRQFRERFVNEFEKDALLRSLFRKYGAYSDEHTAHSPCEVPKWGISTLDWKRAYTAATHKEFSNWPENYAQKLASAESESAFRQILGELPEFDLSGFKDLDSRLEAIVKELLNRNLRPTVFLVSWQSVLGTVDQELSCFKPTWRIPKSRNQGWGMTGEIPVGNRLVPVFSVSNTDVDPNLACALVLPGSFTWRQLSPLDAVDDAGDCRTYFHIPILNLSSQSSEREKIIADDPAWLRNQTDKDRYLSLRVWLKIFERYQIRAQDLNQGLKFALSV
jgi:hypothetical protein